MTKEERNKRRKELREEKIKNGMCPTCTNKIDDLEYKQCSDCRKKAAEYRFRSKEKHREEINAKQRERNAYRLKNNLCSRCGKKLIGSGRRCEECVEKEKVASREIKEFRISMGFCPRCGKNKLVGKEKNCVECNAKSATYQQENVVIDKEKRNAYHKKVRDNREELGLCKMCGKKVDDNRYKHCSMCRSKTRELSKTRRIKQGFLTKEERFELAKSGICYKCGKRGVKKGLNSKFNRYVLCEECYKESVRCLEIGRRNIETSYWRGLNKELFKGVR